MKKKKEEFNYFDAFEKSAKLAKDSAKELKRYIFDFKSTDSEVEMKKIHDLENEGDKNLHELKNYLLKDFLPPIDREDILEISYKIDDLIDRIDEIAIDINIYNVTEIMENMKETVELLEKVTSEVYNLVVEFKNIKKMKEIKEKVIEVNNLEEQADRLYENSIRELYKNERDLIQIVKWSNIYETLEDCFDACEEIADCIEDVILKNT